MICLISFSTFLDVLPTFTCARAIGNFSIICLEINILRLTDLYLASDIIKE